MILSSAEQSDLVAQAKSGDQRASAELLKFMERDIQGMTRKEKCSSADREDLAQIARIAILKAVQTFNPDAGKQFRFYSADWAREDVRRHATVLSSIVVRNVHTKGADTYMDAPIAGAMEGCYQDLMESPNPNPEEQLSSHYEAARLRQVLESIIARLKAQDSAKYNRNALARSLVYDRLLAPEPMNLGDIAHSYGVARETVRKLEVAILAMARKVLLSPAHGLVK